VSVSESVSEFEFVFEGGWRERGRVRNPSPARCLFGVARKAPGDAIARL